MDTTNVQDLLDQSLLCEMWKMFVSTGVSLSNGFDAMGSAFPKYESNLHELKNRFENGEDLMNYFRDSVNPFHPLFVLYLNVGESQHTLDIMLTKLGEYLRIEADLTLKSVSSQSIAEMSFYRHLSTMINSRVPLVYGLDALIKYSSFPPKEVLTKIKNDIIEISYPATLEDTAKFEEVNSCNWDKLSCSETKEKAKTTNLAPFAAALAKHPNHFPKFVVQLVKAGEESASLEFALQKLADYYEKKLRTELIK